MEQTLRHLDTLPVKPVRIEHSVDAAVDATTGAVEHRYNFLDYYFAHSAGEIRARTYLDEIEKVALYLPDGASFADDSVKAVVAYLRFRFQTVERLTPGGYAPVPS